LSEDKHVFVQAATDTQPEKSYKFIIEFGLHCFTKAPNTRKKETLNDYPRNLYYRDSRETRIFCFDRYRLSFGLPDIAKSVADRQCYNTEKGNFFLIELVDADGQEKEYEIYFKVTRSGKGLLRLFIQSAYIRDAEHDGSQPAKKKINFYVIAYKVQIKQEIR